MTTQNPAARFEQVAPIVHFPDLEARVLAFWKEEDVFHRSQQARAGRPTFVFYEGPPTANGLPHNGHVLTRVIKDVFPRYKTMRGYHVPRKAGWDTHGLPVEIEVEKELRISGKAAIEQYGVEPFVRRCIESVFRYTEEWERLTEQLGFWIDLNDPYVTFHESYVESVWWALSELWKKGLLYQGHKVVWWWPQGGTALSQAEVGEGYREVEDPSVYVRFPLLDEPASLVVWTTTPWTLPSNMFAAVKPDVEYALVRDGEERLIVAGALVEQLAGKLRRELPVERTLPGAELVGRRYSPPFGWYAQAAGVEGVWRVVAADFVELGTGTGVVHIAPAFGADDFNVLRALQKDEPGLPLLCALRADGTFDPAVAPERHGGRTAKDKETEKELTRELRERGLVVHLEQVRHQYPFCVRSDKDPLIQFARPAWYIRTTSKIQDAIANNQQVQWLPETIREGRFGDFLRNNVDWALSRERFWGTPLNVWINDQTGAIEAPPSVAAILAWNPAAFAHFEDARRADPSLSPHLRVHKPWIDQVTFTKPGEPGVYRRVPDVIDCWFDSGAMPFAQWGWPHRGQERFEQAFPADFISEAIDQTRGWFYSLLMISTLLFEERARPHPYRTCIVLGHVCDREGRKESKSKGNYTPPDVILDRVRLQFAVAPAPEVKAGEAVIAREDYEGLDLSGDGATLFATRSDDPDRLLELTVRPSRALGELARRVVLLHPEDMRILEVEAAPHGRDTRAAEVPRLPAERRVWLEDLSSPAPGADAFRWFFFASNPPWSQTRHSLSAVRTHQRELPLKLRNVYGFFTIYANIDGFDPTDATCRAGRRAARERALLDRWVLSELALTTRTVVEHMDAYRLYEATQALTAFVDGLSNWYVRRSRDRFWEQGLGPDKLDAHWTLYECLTALARLLAPFLPFATEDIWQNLVRRVDPAAARSVHLTDYPEPDLAAIDEDLSRVMGTVRDLVSLGLQVRTSHKLRVRQPLQEATLVLARPELEPAVAEHVELIRDELNVKEVRFLREAGGHVTYQVKPNFRALGPRVGKAMPKVKQLLGKADGAALLAQLQDRGLIALEVDGQTIELGPQEVEVALEAREGFAAASGRVGVVVLTTTLTPELIDEGLFREVLHRVQDLRKELKLEYTARIRLTLDGAGPLLAAVRPRVAELERETLAREVLLDMAPLPEATVHEGQVQGEPLRIGLLVADGAPDGA